MATYPEKVYLNGEILDSTKATISVFDRGFLFGDGVYEVMLQVNGSFFYGKEHLDRFAECLEKINIKFDVKTLPKTINNLLVASNLIGEDCLLYIQVTRGVAPRKHAFPARVEPTLMMYALPYVLPSVFEESISVRTTKDFRWHRCDIKMTSLLGNVMANDAAAKSGNYETVFFREDKITEASHSNIFFVKKNIVYTHPANENILNGITRKVVVQLCIDNGIEIKEIAISTDEITMMDEAFLTGTTTQVASIQKMDNHVFYAGDNVGPITLKLQKLFSNLTNTYKSSLE